MNKTSTKECDDGNKVAGDGCSPFCKVEDGFHPNGTEICGDGLNMRQH
jgi:cysteine-rich repeat protein